MSAFSTIILVCSINISHGDCTPDTAIDVIRGGNVENEIMCAMGGQSMLAATALVPREGLEFTKIMCVRSKGETMIDMHNVFIVPED